MLHGRKAIRDLGEGEMRSKGTEADQSDWRSWMYLCPGFKTLCHLKSKYVLRQTKAEARISPRERPRLG